MADIAIIFHWPPDCMYSMGLGELMYWRNLAVQRHNVLHAPPPSKK